MKLFGRDQNKDNAEKPIIYYYAKYIGGLGTNISLPIEVGAHVHIFEDRIEVELLKSKSRTVILYKNMTDVQNLDAGDKLDIDRVVGIGIIAGRLWKRHRIITVIKYTDDVQASHIMAIDFLDDTKYAQPLIYKKMREVQGIPFIPPNQTMNQAAVVSTADELSKLAKLKEQGVLTEEEFSQMKNNLMKRNNGKMNNTINEQPKKGEQIDPEIMSLLLEKEQIIASAFQKRHVPGGSMHTPNAIYVTNIRVLYKNPKWLGMKANIVDVHYKDISNTHLKRGIFSTEIYLEARHHSDEIRLPAVDKDIAAEIHSIIQKGISGELLGQSDTFGIPQDTASVNADLPRADNNTTHPLNQEAVTSPKVDDPLKILKIRFAKGEITKEQYEEMRKMLES